MERVVEKWRAIHGARDTALAPEDALLPFEVVEEARAYTSLYKREVYDDGRGCVETWEEKVTLEEGEVRVRVTRTRYGITVDRVEARGHCGPYRLYCVGGIHYLLEG